MFKTLDIYRPKTRSVSAIKLTPENIRKVSQDIRSCIAYVGEDGVTIWLGGTTLTKCLGEEPNRLHIAVTNIYGNREFIKMGDFLVWRSDMGFGSMSEQEFLDKFELNTRADVFGD